MIEAFSRAADERRKEMMWLTLALLAALGLALFLVVDAGAGLMRGSDDRAVIFGLVIFLGCAIAYVAAKEREQRLLNQSLIESLRGAVW